MFRKDEWLSEQIGKSVYQLKANDLLEDNFSQDWKEFRMDHIKENYFVFSKISTNSVNMWQCLEKANFKLIDTNVKFELHGNISSDSKHQKDIDICFAEKKHQQATGKIARDNFIYSRFHLDPLIDNDIASQIKQNWVKNYFFGKRGDEMVLALLHNKPGFRIVFSPAQQLSVDGLSFDLNDFPQDKCYVGRDVIVHYLPNSKLLLSVVPLQKKNANDVSVDSQQKGVSKQSTAKDLTELEVSIVQLMAEGDADKVIARKLNLEPATVRTYNTTLYRKLGVSTRKQASEKAISLRIIDVN